MSEEQDHVDVVLEEPKIEKKDELEIEIADEKPAKAENTEKPPVIEPQEGIQELKRRLEAEQYARHEAERRAQIAAQHAEAARGHVEDANYQLVVNAIETLKERSDTLKSAYKEAMSVGDYDKLADIQEAISVNASQLSELKRGEKAMKDAMKEAEERAQRQPVEPMPRNADPIEEMASRVSEKSASWLRANRANLQDQQKIGRMFRAHQDAVEDGITADSDEYFAYIENRLGIRKQAAEDNAMSEAAAPAAPRRAPQPPPAPVSRGTPRPNVIRLTRDQAEHAKMFGMSEKEYALELTRLREEGKIAH